MTSVLAGRELENAAAIKCSALPPGWPKTVPGCISQEAQEALQLSDDNLNFVTRSISPQGAIVRSDDAAFIFVIHPNSRTRTLFDGASLFMLAFDAVVVPYVLAWEPPIEGMLLFMAW